jgi:hypothetical protein
VALCLVDLRGRLSNPEVRRVIEHTYDVLTHRATSTTTREEVAPNGPRRWSMRDRLNDDDVLDLVRSFLAGTQQKVLAERYGISLRSVGRIVRKHGARKGS